LGCYACLVARRQIRHDQNLVAAVASAETEEIEAAFQWFVAAFGKEARQSAP